MSISRVVAAALLIVITASCSSSDGGSSSAVKRDLGTLATVPPSTDRVSGARIDIRRLVLRQFDDVVRIMQSWDGDFEEPEVLLLDTDSTSGAYARACNRRLGPGGPFYCRGDNTVYFDLGWLDDYARRSVNGALRDGAVLATVAHEIGHAWYAHVGFVNRDATSLRKELFADCIAGAVIADAYEKPDAAVPLIQQAAENAYSVGDYNAQSPSFHGTPGQRRDATLRGGAEGHDACEAYVT